MRGEEVGDEGVCGKGGGEKKSGGGDGRKEGERAAE